MKFEVYRDNKGWRWRLKAANGEIMPLVRKIASVQLVSASSAPVEGLGDQIC